VILPLHSAVEISCCFHPLDFKGPLAGRQDRTNFDADRFRGGSLLEVGAIKLADESLGLAAASEMGVNAGYGLPLGDAVTGDGSEVLDPVEESGPLQSIVGWRRFSADPAAPVRPGKAERAGSMMTDGKRPTRGEGSDAPADSAGTSGTSGTTQPETGHRFQYRLNLGVDYRTDAGDFSDSTAGA
jgi:hypothetical protein